MSNQWAPDITYLAVLLLAEIAVFAVMSYVLGG